MGSYALTLAKSYLTHCNKLKFWKHKKFKASTKSKVWFQDLLHQIVHIPKSNVFSSKFQDGNANNIVSYCTALTLDGCAQSCEIFYHLTITDESDENKPNTSQKQLSTLGIINLKTYRAKKMKENQLSNEKSMENNDDIEWLYIGFENSYKIQK